MQEYEFSIVFLDNISKSLLLFLSSLAYYIIILTILKLIEKHYKSEKL